MRVTLRPTVGKAPTYPSLDPLIAARINVALIRTHWSDILRVSASIRTGTVTTSLILRQLASYSRQNGVAAALRELGRMERTLFTLDWLEDPELRRETRNSIRANHATAWPGEARRPPAKRRTEGYGRADCCPLISYRLSLARRRVICHAEAARRSLAASAKACCVASSE
jgi:hypothetical protein